MKYWLIFKQSIKGVTSNKVRSFLTILGIVIGIGSVIALVSLVSGVKVSISDQINKLGSTNLIISSGKSRFTQPQTAQSGNKQGPMGGQNPQGEFSGGLQAATLTTADFNDLSNKAKQPNIKLVSGSISGTSLINTKDGEQSFQVAGSPTTTFDIQSLKVATGRLYNNQDLSNNARVAVLGSQAAADAFGTDDPIGKTVKIGTQDYQIIGVLSEKTGSSLSDPNSYVYVPYTSLSKDTGVDKFTRITVQVTSEGLVNSTKTEVENLLLKNHGLTDIKKADFSVMSSQDLLASVSTITGMMSALLGGIAGISLVVGGIGIMNIMLVSVTERTREIGLRKAVGAKTRDILAQFLAEAVILTIIGGALGIVLGFVVGQLISKLVDVTPVITLSSIVLAVSVSAIVGIVFGIYPAIKASMMSPIDALRYE
ncbi:MAG: ABC transporter permease [bacterium]